MTDKVKKAPVEPKVSLGTIAGGSGAILSALLLWLLGVTIFGVEINADQADDAIAAVPWPVAGVVALVLSVGGYFFGGYMAPHAPRPEDATQTIVVNNVSSIPEYVEPDDDSNVALSDVDPEDESVSEAGIPNDPEKV